MGTGYTRNDTSNNIADGNVINASDLDGEFDAVQAAFNGTTGHSHDGTSGEGPQIDTAGIAADAIDGTKIADDSINSEHYVDGSIDTAHIGNLQVTTAKIAADAIDGTKLADNAVDSEHYTDGSIDRVHLAADIVDGTKIADDSIDSEHYVDGSIDTAHIANDAVTGDKLANNIQVAGTLGVTGETTLSANLNLGDNDKAIFGAGDDLQIYHTGTESIISDAGTGNLKIYGENLELQATSTGETYFNAIANGAVTLYHNNSAKLATKTDGVDITGELQSDSLDVDGNADISGTLAMGNNISFVDGKGALFGASNDLQIYHDAATGKSHIYEQGTGALVIQGTNIEFDATDGTSLAEFNDAGAVSLRYSGDLKLATKSDGVLITGELEATTLDINGNADISGQLTMHNNVNLQDGDILQLGSSQDLQIYHDGSNSIIKDNGTGNLFIDGSSTINFRSGDGGEYYAVFNDDGKVSLRYNNVEKFATKSDGVDITGELQADSLDIDGAANISGTLTMGGNIDLQDNDDILIGSSDDLQLRHDGSNSYIEDIGTGSLVIRGTDVYLQDREGNNFAVFDDTGTGGTVTLYHNAVSKLNTTSSGININGVINAVDTIYLAGAIYHEGDTDTYTQFHAANQWRVVTGGTEMLEVNDSYLLLGANSVGNVQTTSVSSAITPNMNVYNSFVLTLTGNITLGSPTTEVAGMSGVFVFIHSGAGRTVSVGAQYETVGGAGLTLSGTSGAVDIVPYYVRSSGNIILGTPQLAVS
jgi:hypothetical protein